ncbi:fluoride efflux transporter FluC [Fervidibacillus halotolerans]|uniref:Fluoride-specific ion channel FluC n=1 Tax=Fervidibacillus halotolerans TaxID=2980027 RepID=A0A9E8S198_9BACI|nr:CrcB family protein [Fervidibacillus halotolerans]WAA13307.1 CrcB family protein [Fervidibacillus halotolerans]
MTVVFVIIGGFLGAIFRFSISGFMNQRTDLFFPVGTFFVNMIGSFLLGLLVGSDQSGSYIFDWFGIGFLGSFTTYSTFMNELVQFDECEEKREAKLYVLISLFFGFLFGWIGIFVGKTFFF